MDKSDLAGFFIKKHIPPPRLWRVCCGVGRGVGAIKEVTAGC